MNNQKGFAPIILLAFILNTLIFIFTGNPFYVSLCTLILSYLILTPPTIGNNFKAGAIIGLILEVVQLISTVILALLDLAMPSAIIVAALLLPINILFGLVGGFFATKVPWNENPLNSSVFRKVLIILLFLILLLEFVFILIGGKYIKNSIQTHNQPQQQVQQPSPTPSKVELLDTSSWKTYTNTEANFTFKYPDDWENKIATNGATLKRVINQHTAPLADTLGIDVIVYKNSGKLKAKEFLQKIFYQGEDNSLTATWIENANITPITVGDKKAEKIPELTQVFGSVGSGAWIPNGNDGIFLRFYLSSVADQDKIYQTLLSTFKFSDSEVKAVRSDVIYPGLQFIGKEDVKPCSGPENCFGSLGPSGGVRYTYKVRAPLYDVWSWYKQKWNLAGGGGGSIYKANDQGEPLEANIPYGQISEKNSEKYLLLYYLDISGDNLSTTVVFSTNDNTSN